MEKAVRKVLEEVMNTLELFPTEVFGRLIVWGTFLVTAFFVQEGLVEYMKMDETWAWIAAAVLEIAGISNIKLLLDMYQYSQERSQKDPVPPLRWAIVLVAVYAFTALLVVYIVEIWTSGAKYIPLSFVVVGFSGGTSVALRSNHKRQLELREKRIQQAREIRAAREKNKKEKIIDGPDWMPYLPKTKKDFMDGVAAGEIVIPADIEAQRLMDLLGIKKRAADRWIGEALRIQNGSGGNGNVS